MEKFIVLDTETTNDIDCPIVYDIGFAVVDAIGKVYESHSYVVADVFLDKELMESAYFAEKIPNYWSDIKNGSRKLHRLKTVKFILRDVIKQYEIKKIFAHNARFDYTSLNTTERYLTSSKYRYFLPYGVEMWDTLKMSRTVLSDNSEYRGFCKDNQFTTQNGRCRFTAEVIYRFLTNDIEFEESHTGLEDVMIEKEILAYCLKILPSCDGKLFQETE